MAIGWIDLEAKDIDEVSMDNLARLFGTATLAGGMVRLRLGGFHSCRSFDTGILDSCFENTTF